MGANVLKHCSNSLVHVEHDGLNQRCEASTSFQLKIKEASHVGWGNPWLKKQVNHVKDVRAYCYFVSLLRTLYMTWRVARHVFQARAPSRNPTKYRADDLCGNLICEYFCSMLGDPHFFFGRSLPFLILSIILKNKKKICTWEVLIISHILFK